jgi:hypothetical protein
MKSDKLIYYVLMGMFVAGVIGIFAFWYLALFAIAVIISIVVLIALNHGNSTSPHPIKVNPKVPIPLEHWLASREAPTSSGSDIVDFRLVNSGAYTDNWAHFKKKAQVSAGETVRVEASLYCIQDIETSLRKIVVAYDRRVLAEFAEIDLHGIFEPMLLAGGVFRVPCEFVFSKTGVLDLAYASVQADTGPQADPEASVDLSALWTIIWRGVRGKL